jgi:hypothetical protein
MASFSPLVLWKNPREFDPGTPWSLSRFSKALSCPSTPPQRLSPLLATLLCSVASLEFLCPSAFSDPSALFLTAILSQRLDPLRLDPEGPYPGFSTRSTSGEPSNPSKPCFRLPTLLGFALQSFSPSGDQRDLSISFLRSCASPISAALQRFAPT